MILPEVLRSASSRQDAELVARWVGIDPPWQLIAVEGEFATATLNDGRCDLVGILARLDPDIEVQSVLRAVLGVTLGTQFEQRPSPRWMA